MMEILFKPKQVAAVFLTFVILLTLIHCVVVFSFFHIENPDLVHFVRWFDLDIEKNVPSLYAAFAIFICAFLFFIIAVHDGEKYNYKKCCWFGLAAVFLFLAMDEGFKIHESIGDITENYVNATGLLYFPWVIPYGLAALGFALFYLKFIFSLPKNTAWMFILSGTIYLTGAMAFDMLGGREAEMHGYDSTTYCILYTIEEFLEMIAIVMLIYGLLSYIADRFGYMSVVFRFRGKDV